jgi:hypothetical protein
MAACRLVGAIIKQLILNVHFSQKCNLADAALSGCVHNIPAISWLARSYAAFDSLIACAHRRAAPASHSPNWRRSGGCPKARLRLKANCGAAECGNSAVLGMAL